MKLQKLYAAWGILGLGILIGTCLRKPKLKNEKTSKGNEPFVESDSIRIDELSEFAWDTGRLLCDADLSLPVDAVITFKIENSKDPNKRFVHLIGNNIPIDDLSEFAIRGASDEKTMGEIDINKPVSMLVKYKKVKW